MRSILALVLALVATASAHATHPVIAVRARVVVPFVPTVQVVAPVVQAVVQDTCNVQAVQAVSAFTVSPFLSVRAFVAPVVHRAVVQRVIVQRQVIRHH